MRQPEVDRARADVDELDPVSGHAAVRLHLVDVHVVTGTTAVVRRPFGGAGVVERAAAVRAAAVGRGACAVQA